MASGDRGLNFATLKYDPNGIELWASVYDGPGYTPFFCCSDYWDEPYDLALDAEGNAYVTGKSRGEKSNDDWATVKYDRSGAEVWVARYDSQDHDNDWAYAVVAARSGDVFVAGTSVPTDPLDFTSAYTLVKYAPGALIRESSFTTRTVRVQTPHRRHKEVHRCGNPCPTPWTSTWQAA